MWARHVSGITFIKYFQSWTIGKPNNCFFFINEGNKTKGRKQDEGEKHKKYII